MSELILCNESFDVVLQKSKELMYSYSTEGEPWLECGMPKFEEVTQGESLIAEKAGNHTFSTCGFFPPWMYWRLGCGKQPFLNRTVPSLGSKYIPGYNMTAIETGGIKAGVYVRYQPGLLPDEGDVFFVSNGPSATEHVGYVRRIDKVNNIWMTTDGGQTTAKGRQCVKRKNRSFKDGMLDGRKVKGWISLKKVHPLLVNPYNGEGTDAYLDNPYL